MNRLSRAKQEAIIQLLVEGNSIRSCERIVGVHRDTIMRLAVKVGKACKRMLNHRLRNLDLDHLQCDEIWTFCRKKQARVRPGEDDYEIGDQFMFVALDESTKLIASFTLGKRTSENTHRFIFDLSQRVCEQTVPQISTDGWPAYPGAVRFSFGNQVEYGTIIKNYHEGIQEGRYGPPEMAAAVRTPMTAGLDPYSICTSHVERNNLTIRLFMRRFTRLTLGFSKKLENLAAAVALHVAHYNYCRLHRTLKTTPAMAAGIADHQWTMSELLVSIGAH
jgi:IS1 family transposase